MVDILQALSWLNYSRKSEIPAPTRYWIDRVQMAGLTENEKKDIIDNLVRSVGKRKNAAEQAEILVNCSAYGYGLGLIGESAQWLGIAASLYAYTGDTHRDAVTSWMQYIIQRGMGKFQRAFDQARRARRIFGNMADLSSVREQTQDESWYRGRILDMTCDLVASPEDMFEWMYEFHGTLLSPSSAQIKDRLAEDVEKRDFSKVMERMQLLLGISLKSPDPRETGEALAYCGIIHWMLENRTEAVQFFRSAMTQFTPGTHEHALLRWMLGLALFAAPADRFDAIANMEKSIDDIDCLREAAIHKNQAAVRDWYAIHHISMKRVLRTKIGDAL